MRALIGLLLVAALATTPRAAAVEAPAQAARATGLQLELVRTSLTGTHYRYRRTVDGVPVLGDFVVSRTPLTGASSLREPTANGLVAIRARGVVRIVREEIGRDSLSRPIVRYRDLETGALLLERPLYFEVKPARIFDPNPVVATNDPSLQDRNDAASAVPEHAYRIVDVEAGTTRPWSSAATVVDVQAPRIAPVDSTGPLVFNRSESGFEDVNAWFHVDRNQRHLQSLGYTGPRQLVPYAIEIDTHATNGADTSYFAPNPEQPGRGTLLFGVGGTDDAEDADLVIHEYGHAILEWISPGTFAGTYNSQERALAEGVTDYWAFSTHYAQRRASGRDPFCLADWDARCWEDDASQNCGYPAGTDCLRRLDVPRTMAEYRSADTAGTEHWNGQIFAGALVQLFLQNVARYGIEEGRRITDTLVIESLFDTPPSPGFVTLAQQLVSADRLLFGGIHESAICGAMASRGILGACSAPPRGELTHHVSGAREVAIPDGDPRGLETTTTIDDPRAIEQLFVRVEVEHPSRGDLRIELIAPDGTVVVLQRPSLDAARDIRATYGRDAIPAESLDVLRGRSAAGRWKLRVADTRTRDTGTVESWSLIIRFAGDGPAAERPTGAPSQVIPVVTHVVGVNGTEFRSEVRILNRGARNERVTLVFTPSGADGRVQFAAAQVSVAPGQLVVLDDVVRGVFATTGSGSLTIVGDVIASSRTYVPTGGGTAGQWIGPGTATTHATLFHAAIDTQFRTNVGATDATGAGAAVRITVRADVGLPPLAEAFVTLPPFGHVQIPAAVPADARAQDLVVEVESSNPVHAYASVVTNSSGDPMYVVDERSTIVPAIMATGANRTTWKTDLIVVQRPIALQVRSYPLTYVVAATGEGSSIELPNAMRGTVWSSDDAVASIGRPETLGLFHVPAAIGVDLRARIYSDAYGTSVPLLAPFSGTRHLIDVESTAQYRTNVGLFSEGFASVQVTVHDSTGAVLADREIALAPMRLVQFPIEQRVSGGYVTIRTLTGTVRAYSSVVDNVTGDPTMVAAR